jgi:hypothetical protein
MNSDDLLVKLRDIHKLYLDKGQLRTEVAA